MFHFNLNYILHVSFEKCKIIARLVFILNLNGHRDITSQYLEEHLILK